MDFKSGEKSVHSTSVCVPLKRTHHSETVGLRFICSFPPHLVAIFNMFLFLPLADVNVPYSVEHVVVRLAPMQYLRERRETFTLPYDSCL